VYAGWVPSKKERGKKNRTARVWLGVEGRQKAEGGRKNSTIIDTRKKEGKRGINVSLVIYRVDQREPKKENHPVI